MRAEISPKEIKSFFIKAKNRLGWSWNQIANFCNVSSRTIRDWKSSKYKIPIIILEKISQKTNIKTPNLKGVNDYWYARNNGRLGGIAAYRKHGNFSTKEGMRLGAIKALRTHKVKNTGFFIPKNIILPKKCEDLAEFVGIILGDGSITRKQVTITLNRYDDADYIKFVTSLSKNLFGVVPSVYLSDRESVGDIVISRISLVSFLLSIGLKVGSKVKNQIDVPEWIKNSNEYSKKCIRGMFDTDGCFYIDKHKYKNKIYYHCAMNFTNCSIPLLSFFKKKLEGLGYHPTQKTKKAIFLRKEEEILRYFQEIDSSNPKHYNKFLVYFKGRYGRVPKWS